MTENHDYNTPEKGARDWHIPLNENFERIDADIEIRDRDDNRSNYTPQDGAKFLATDTGNVYTGDGSSWNAIGHLSDARIYVQDSEPGDAEAGDIWIRPQ